MSEDIPGASVGSRAVAREAAEQPMLWAAAAVVFAAAAFLSASRGDWWPAALGALTGVLAGCTAFAVALAPLEGRNRTARGTFDAEPGEHGSPDDRYRAPRW